MTRLSSSDWVQATRTSARSAPASRVDGTSASPCTARSPALASADSRPGSVSMTVTSSPAPWSASATCSASPFPPITTIRIRTTSPEKAPQPAKRGRGDDEGQDVTVLQRRRRLGDLGVPRPAQLHHTDLAGHVELGDPPPGQVGRDSGPDEQRLPVAEGLMWLERAMVQQLDHPVDGSLHGPDGGYAELGVDRRMNGIVQPRWLAGAAAGCPARRAARRRRRTPGAWRCPRPRAHTAPRPPPAQPARSQRSR